MTDHLTLTTAHVRGRLAVAAIGGDIDIETAPALRTHGLNLIAQGHPHLILDLTHVTFCDSSGLNALIGIMRCATAANGSLTLAAVPDRLARMLDLTGISTAMPSYPSATAAMNARLTEVT
ncbi:MULTISPECIES: STAS domain-containing protein [unclassified Streptomyces]|uniref:STAS domain-containing protein n=1 Tax=unclassified Streptomyces TaxID=2593676 RepID=UPI003666C2E2